MNRNPSEHEQKLHGTKGFPCGCYEITSEHKFVPWHWHEEFEIGIITKGTAKCNVGHMTKTIKEGDGLFINSGVLHTSTLSRNDGGSRKSDLVFSGRLVYGSEDSDIYLNYIRPIIYSDSLSGIFLSRKISWQSKILDLYETAYNACHSNCEFHEIITRNIFSEIFMIIYDNNRELLSNGITASTKQMDFERLKTMLSFIETHYSESITLSDISESANICTREALRNFKNNIGKSPIQYLINYRILMSCEMLQKGTASITDISSACGFNNPSYYSETFKKCMGCSPGKYIYIK